MKKFRFTLQSLLGVKVSLEKQKTAELAEQSRVVRMLEGEFDETKRRLNNSVSEFNRKMEAGGMPQGDAVSYSGGFRAARDRLAEQLKRIMRAEEVREKLQKELTELMGERKMLEKIRERQYQEYLVEVAREDAKAIDDFLSNKISGGE
ncbi:hypothetical protein FACS1894208_04780 [Clostridia bacterium]|nr:hypothetical protein FACS1894208_04780 [Clostridia bacterium]